MSLKQFDTVNKAKHYNIHPIFSRECIEYVRDMTFASGNAFKYIYRHQDKINPPEDINKAIYYCRLDDHATGNVDEALLEEMRHDIQRWRESDDTYTYSKGVDVLLCEVMLKLYQGEDVEQYIPLLEEYSTRLQSKQ